MSKNNKEELVRITLRATKGEKETLEEKASQANKSTNRYLIDTALTAPTSCKRDAFQLAQRLIRLQRMVNDIEDQMLQKKMGKECAQVWHGLESLTRVENTMMMNP